MKTKELLFILVSITIIALLNNYVINKQSKPNKPDKPDNNDGPKLLGLNENTWGWVSVVTNGLSVIIQMINLYTTKSAQSFSMPFIVLMTILNFTYFIVGLLTNNMGLAIATFSFVIYNLTVVYYYYFGKQK